MLIRRMLRDDAWKVAIFFAMLVGNVFATLLAYPTFQKNYAMILEVMPGFLGDLVKNVLDTTGASGLLAFSSLSHFFRGANVLGVAIAVLLVTGTIAREVEIGSIGMLLSRPLSRTRVLLTFALVQLAELAVPLFVATLSIPPLASLLLGESVAVAPLLRGALHATAFLALVYAIGLLVAVLASEQLVVAAVTGGICVVSFVLYFIEATRPYTLYQLSSFETYGALARGDPLDVVTVGSCAGAAAVLISVAVVCFRRRDF